MINTLYKCKKVDFAKVAKSRALPNQSMTISEIVSRYVKGLAPDVVQREKVFLDQNEFDLEKLGRLDRADQAYQAREFKERSESLAQQIRENEAAKHERIEAEQNSEQGEQRDNSRSGIDNLDNTMPDDTALNSNEMRGQKNQSQTKSNQHGGTNRKT